MSMPLPKKTTTDKPLMKQGPGHGILLNSYDDGSKESKNNKMLQALKKRQEKNIQKLAQNPGEEENALAKANNAQLGKPTKSLRPKEEKNY